MRLNFIIVINEHKRNKTRIDGMRIFTKHAICMFLATNPRKTWETHASGTSHGNTGPKVRISGSVNTPINRVLPLCPKISEWILQRRELLFQRTMISSVVCLGSSRPADPGVASNISDWTPVVKMDSPHSELGNVLTFFWTLGLCTAFSKHKQCVGFQSYG